MARKLRKPRRPGKRNLKMREPLKCRYCGEKGRDGKRALIDYKDIDSLQKMLTQRGKIFSRKRSGNCAFHQRQLQRAVKYARFMALLPYTS